MLFVLKRGIDFWVKDWQLLRLVAAQPIIMASPTISQINRAVEIRTPLGKDVLGLRSFVLKEQLSRPFVIEAELSSDDPDIKFDDITGHPVTIRMTTPGGTDRYFNAIVARFVMVGQVGHFFHYRATLMPWLWALTRSADCRMFQSMSVPDIVQHVFRDRGVKDFELGITGSYPTSEYCIQYRETDFDFVSRLLEREGINYFFKHTESQGVLVLADDKSAYSPVSGVEKIVYRPTNLEAKHQDAIKSWVIEREVQPTEYALNDYNFLTPKQSLMNLSQIGKGYGLNDRQVYDYPGDFQETADGERLARIRLEERQVAAEVMHAETTCMAFSAGSLFTLADHPRADQNVEHLITSLQLQVDAGEFTSTDRNTKFHCDFTAIPSEQPFRPARVTPRPVIQGPQPAMVVGPDGEEIYTDQHGRVKVHFFWDRDSKSNEKSSCWVRVSQLWAGKGWGAIHLPRIGQEVIVEFLEGDPDRPIITGRVYNSVEKPPYALPADKNISTIKSESTKGGGGFNEVKMDDTKGKELLYIQAEKDRAVLVKNDNAETVKHDEIIEIGNNRTKHVKKNEDVTIDENRTEEVKKNEDITIGVNRTEEVKKNEDITIGENRTEEVKKNEEVKIGENRTHDVGKKDILKVGKELLIDVGDQITIQTGQSSIIMKKDGTIQIKGKDISITGSGKINIKASSDLVLKGSKIAEN